MNEKNPTFRNYVPHTKWEKVREFETGDEYLENLSRIVGAACDKFLRSRNLEILQMGLRVIPNDKQRAV